MIKLFLAVAALAAAPIAANAAQIVLTPASVTAASGYYSACCDFRPGNILDQQTGAIVETSQSNYWLNPDNGPANAFITIDLGKSYKNLSFELYNTHNAGYQDRGTGSFTLTSGATTLVSGTLAAEPAGSQALTAQTFTGAAGAFRFITFNPTSVAVNGTPCCGSNNYGLNELRVFGTAVPEPASWALMLLGFAMTGVAARRRSAAVVA